MVAVFSLGQQIRRSGSQYKRITSLSSSQPRKRIGFLPSCIDDKEPWRSNSTRAHLLRGGFFNLPEILGSLSVNDL